MTRDRWDIATEGGKTLLRRNGTPVARFYAGRMTADELASMLAKLNRGAL